MWQLEVADDKEEEEDMEAKYVPVEGDDEGGGGGTPGGDHSKSPMQVSKSERAKRCGN